MKKLSYLFIGACILATGCKKEELDLFPYNQKETSQAFNTETDITIAVNGMYEGIKSSGSYHMGIWNIVADAMSDNLILNQQGRLTLRPYSEWRLSGNSTYGLFAGGYTIVRRANAILENIDKFPDGAFKDNAKGEALAVRAMTYFDMARVYGKTYLNASATDSVLPYVTTTDPTIMPSKEPVKGFYDKVIKDLNDAATLIGTGNGMFRFNKASVYGILSRVNLYKGDWPAAIAAANSALGTTPEVANIATFPKIWTDETSTGVLFKIRNTTVDNINNLGVNYWQKVSGEIKSEYNVSYAFYQEFSNDDVRKSTYIETSDFNGVTYNHVVKYAGRPGQPAGVLDAKVIRAAEVLLNRAEAYYRDGNEGAALADLRLLKANRYTGYVDENLSGQDLLDEILRQRRLELAFEGDRFWDLKRRNQPVQRDGTKGDEADGGGVSYLSNAVTMPAGDHRFQLPYPQSELNFNKNLTQNPDY